MAHSLMVCTVDVHQLAAIVRNRIDSALVLDSRSFLEYNAAHVVGAINVGCAKLMKRRLQQEKLSIEDFLSQNCHWDVDRSIDIIVYDQSTRDPKCLPPDSFMAVFLQKLLPVYNSVSVLKGGFLEFQSAYPNLCENERTKFAPLTSLSQPCLSVTNHGPTRILPFLYLGSQHDALNQEGLLHHNITYQLNVSTNCPKPDFIKDSHFLRIPVIDNYSEKLLPHFSKAFQFLDKVRESGGCVLVHCLAGISRSATVAIAYVMKSLKMNSDEAYRYVKAKRATISPNFNFLGQLLEFENILKRECVLKTKAESSPSHMCSASSPSIRQKCKNDCCKVEDGPCLCYYSKFQSRALSEIHENAAPPVVSPKSVFKSSSSTKQSLITLEQVSCRKQEISFSVSKPLSTNALNIKCLPISHLKDISFTPCQTFTFKSMEHVSNGESAMKSPTGATSPRRLETGSPNSYKRAVQKSDSGISDVSDYGLELRSHQNIHSPPDLKHFDFDSKPYDRSDSVSTSGLGSEGSDCADSWNEFTSSCERETDILMDDDYPTVPTPEDELRRNKMLGFEDSYGDSLSMYPKFEFPLKYHPQPLYIKSFSVDGTRNRDDTRRLKCEASKYSAPGLVLHMNDFHTVQCDKNASGSHLLYRAQSCPGMLTSETTDACTADENCSGNHPTVKLRKPKHEKFSIDKCRNRYSCSSIDYMDYSTGGGMSEATCPVAGTISRPDRSNVSSSHCNYRHSMIQVS